MKEAFAKREIANRQFSDAVKLSIQNMLRRKDYHKIPHSLLEKNDRLLKNGPGDISGTGDGAYDQFHKKSRVQWHDTIKV